MDAAGVEQINAGQSYQHAHRLHSRSTTAASGCSTSIMPDSWVCGMPSHALTWAALMA